MEVGGFMLVYLYDEITKEYIGSQQADSDPAESEAQGKFIPLVPANATLIECPQFNRQVDIAVFENGGWVIKKDYRKLYVVDDNFVVNRIDTIDKPQQGYIVDKTIADQIMADADWFYIADDKIVKKTQQQYDEDKRRAERQRLDMLSMTKYDFFKYICQPNGMTYQQLMTLINSDDNIAAAWNLCAAVYRGDPILVEQISKRWPELDLDAIFERYGS